MAWNYFSALFYLAMGINQIWFGLAFAAVFCWIWIVFGVFLYKPWFDMFFKQEISQNVYGELTPPDGKYDYTIVLSGHTDTSWNWKHSANLYWFKKNPVLGLIAAYAKTAIAAVCFIILSVISVFMAVVYSGYYFGAMWAAQLLASQGLLSSSISSFPAGAHGDWQFFPGHVGRSQEPQRLPRRNGQRHRLCAQL